MKYAEAKGRISKSLMLELEKAMINGDFKFSRTQKKLPIVKQVRSSLVLIRNEQRNRKLRAKVRAMKNIKHYTIYYPGKNYRLRSSYGVSGKPVTSIVYMGFGSFSFNLAIPSESIPKKNPKRKILAAYEDQIVDYIIENIERLCTKNIIKQTVIRNKTSIKIKTETIHKPTSLRYTLKMCNVDKQKIFNKIRKDIRVIKGKRYYD